MSSRSRANDAASIRREAVRQLGEVLGVSETQLIRDDGRQPLRRFKARAINTVAAAIEGYAGEPVALVRYPALQIAEQAATAARQLLRRNQTMEAAAVRRGVEALYLRAGIKREDVAEAIWFPIANGLVDRAVESGLPRDEAVQRALGECLHNLPGSVPAALNGRQAISRWLRGSALALADEPGNPYHQTVEELGHQAAALAYGSRTQDGYMDVAVHRIREHNDYRGAVSDIRVARAFGYANVLSESNCRRLWELAELADPSFCVSEDDYIEDKFKEALTVIEDAGRTASSTTCSDLEGVSGLDR